MYVLVDLKKQNEIGNLLPGTFCNVTIPVQRIARAIRLPRRALYDNNTVYIAQQKRLVKRKVNIAYLDSESVLVVGGLQDGDLAITTQLADPIEGTPVFTHEN
jgi:membrane fusion protein (multidrug efflux system)